MRSSLGSSFETQAFPVDCGERDDGRSGHVVEWDRVGDSAVGICERAACCSALFLRRAIMPKAEGGS